MGEHFEGSGNGQFVSAENDFMQDKRRLRQFASRKHHLPANTAERQALMDGEEREADADSDLEQNVTRLRQYLSGNSDLDECETESTPISSASGRCVSRKKKRSTRNNGDRRINSVDTSSGCSDDTDIMSTEVTELRQFPPTADKPPLPPGGGIYHKRVGKPVLPHDFLNIPPPAHPPDDSPTLENRPLPPQRQPPPVPFPESVTTGINTEESQYEEAKPIAPVPAARPSKQSRPGSVTNVGRIVNGFETNVAPHHLPPAPVYQYQENDWFDIKANVLERNPETGSFYIPSGHTTMSSLSPQSRKLDLDSKHNYSLLPAAGTTVPVNVLPLRPEYTGGSTHHGMKTRVPPNLRHRPDKLKSGWMKCTWKCLTYCLVAALIFSLAVICYLLVTLLSNSGMSKVVYPGSTGYGINGGSTKEHPIALRPVPESFELGDLVVADLVPGIISYSYFALQRDSHVQFNLSVPAQAKLAIYGRQTLAPSPTQYDFQEIILGEKLHSQPQKRAISNYGYPEQNLRGTIFVQYLLAGRWHLGFLNDDTQVQTVKFSASLTPSTQINECKYGCYGKGVCKDGKCYCYAGYTGPFCEETVCPVLCSGNGIFTGGHCHCHQGYKGNDCDVPENVCEVPNCGGNGRCNYGRCVCDQGWSGKYCQEKACPHHNCSGHGVCVKGICYCEFGWASEACQEAYTSEQFCPSLAHSNLCSKHGTWDPLAKKCLCNENWIGNKCQIEICTLNCHSHGKCKDQKCHCDHGFTGDFCESRSCQIGCDEHGKCVDGTCVCDEGWNGQNCQLEGCPKNCNGNGICRQLAKNWMCECNLPGDSGFVGKQCDIPMEYECNDGRDNDNDGLTDCEDSECCSNSACQNHHLCQTVNEPRQLLIREQAPPPQSSFYQKTKFLLQHGSVQQYADVTLFNSTHVSVVRGRVVTVYGGALTGVRVADKANALRGFTLSRAGGKFDLMVNGGGSVTLQFLRQPFGSVYHTVEVPWNRIIYIGDVVMAGKDDLPPHVVTLDESCKNYEQFHRIAPELLPSWKTGRFAGNIHSKGQLLVDSQSIYQTIPLPGTDELKLTYHSVHAAGYQSALWLYLVPEKMPENLRAIKLKIDIEGIHFEKNLEAMPNLTYMYGWDKRNVYKQKVYGLTTAKVSVGYLYAKCSKIFWEKREVKLEGYKSGLVDLGGWNLNIHHHFDVRNGVVEKGDGSMIYLAEEQPIIDTAIGTDRQRPLNCPFCNSLNSKVSLFSPMALATGPDSSLYVGDYNLIRRISPNGTVTTVLELSPADTAHQYYLAIHPITAELYISLPLRRQIWKVTQLEAGAPSDPSSNYQVVVGNGQPCVFDHSCGDGGPAEMAQLTFPKGIAFDSQGSLYLADERKIRVVRSSGFITTLIGSELWRPLACQSEFSIDQLRLQWPTALTVDPLTDRLLILDSDVVIRLNDMAQTARIVVGAPPHCSVLTDSQNSTDRPILLKGATSLVVDRNRGILLSETDGKRTHRIRAFDGVGRSELIAGAESKCNCDRKNCPCDDPTLMRARDAHLHGPCALAVGPDGIIHVADQGNFKVRSIKPSLPQWNPYLRQYDIFSTDSNEVYMFNRFGQHVATKSLLRDAFVYNFTYHVDTAFGLLTHVTGSGGQRLYLVRKSPSEIQIENSLQQKALARIDNLNSMLKSFESPDGGETKLEYDANTQLLMARINPGGTATFFDYDKYGHAVKIFTETGDIYEVEPKVSNSAIVASVTKNGDFYASYRSTESELRSNGIAERTTYLLDDGTSFHTNALGAQLNFDSITHSLLAPHQTALLRQKLVLPSVKSLDRMELSSRFEWRLYLRREGRGSSKRIVQVGRKTRVNGLNVLAVEYDRKKNVDKITNQNGDPLLTVEYNNAGFVSHWKPNSPDLASMNISYDAIGRLLGYTWGEKQANFKYDARGRITKQTGGADENLLSRKYSYKEDDSFLPTVVEVPSRVQYFLKYDNDGGLDQIVTPSAERHTFRSFYDFGSLITIRQMPFNEDPFVIVRNDRHKPTSVLFPSGQRRVSYSYAKNDKLSQIFHDGQRLTFTYSAHSGLIEQIHSQSLQRDFVRQGPLIAEMYERHHDLKLSQTSSAHFAYSFDARLRVTSIQASFNDDQTMESQKFEFDVTSGRLVRVKDFNYQYVASKVRIMGRDVVMESIVGSERQLTQTRVTIRGRKVCEQHFGYDSLGRITEIKTFHLDSQFPTETRTYNVDGELSQLNVDGDTSRSWTSHYDVDGRLKALNSDKLVIENGIPISFGELPYSTDTDGAVTKRGEENFSYDSFGRLIGAWKKGVYDIMYSYDEQNRLIMRSSEGRILHFYYAFQEKPNLLTHIYDSQSQSSTVFFYDAQNNLFAFERNGIRYYVVCGPDGGPRYIFDGDGTAMKTVFRAPFGRVVDDSDPNFHLVVGHRGLFQDPQNGIIIDQGKPIDQLTGRFMSVNMNILLANPDPYFPETVDIFGVNRGNKLDNNWLFGFDDWLRFVGVEIKYLVPLLGTSTINGPSKQIIDHLCPPDNAVSLAAECSLRNRMPHFNRFLTLYPSTIIPQTPYGSANRLRWSSTPSVYGYGITLSNYSNEAVLNIADNVDRFLQDAMIILLNQSTIIPVAELEAKSGSVIHHHFWKADRRKALEELSTLGVKGDSATLTPYLNVTVIESQDIIRVKVSSNVATLTLHYGGSVETIIESTLSHIEERTVAQLWQSERSLADNERPSRFTWTSSQLDELSANGIVTGFEPIFMENRLFSSELLSDINCWSLKTSTDLPVR